MKRHHPYTFTLLILLLAVVWLLSHEACAHPIGNLIASLVAFGYVPFRLLFLLEAHA